MQLESLRARNLRPHRRESLRGCLRALFLVLPLAGGLALAGCGSGESSVMPEVTGTKLDTANASIEKAGFDGEVDVDGGGVFGVVVESNWEVCGQTPRAGEPMSDAPRLRVERSCPRENVPADRPTETPADRPTETTAEEAPAPSQPKADPVLTPRSNEDLRKMLKVTDYCDDAVGRFATKYSGRKIRFNGSVVNLMNHGDYETRFDILVGPGGDGPGTTAGPALKFDDVSLYDMKVKGADGGASITAGDRFQFTAEVGEFNEMGCLLQLEPVTTEVG